MLKNDFNSFPDQIYTLVKWSHKSKNPKLKRIDKYQRLQLNKEKFVLLEMQILGTHLKINQNKMIQIHKLVKSKKAIPPRKNNLQKKKKNVYSVVSIKMKRVKQILRKEANKKKTKMTNKKRSIRNTLLLLIMLIKNLQFYFLI